MGALLKHSRRSIRTGCETCGITYTAGDESTYLYLAHDTTMTHGEYCEPCDSFGPLVLMNPDGTFHPCRVPDALRNPKATPVKATPVATPVTTPESTPKPVAPVTAPVTTPDAESDLSAALRRLLGTPQIDRAQVELIAREVAKEVTEGLVFPERVIVVRDNVRHEVKGTSHAKLPDVITDLMAGEHVMMVGPAGTGKSTIADQAAEALGIKAYAISCGPTMPVSQIVGYMTATGDYVRSLFREAYENGGLFHFDEIDNSHPSLLAVINQALANGHTAFPDGMVARHPDFRCVASANTYGKGADRQYVGRQAIDAATLDRFTIETIEIDEALERQLCVSAMGSDEDAGAVADQVLRLIRKLRRNAADKRMTVVLSPRASVGMCRLLAAGRMWEDALESRVRRGMSDADWAKLNV